MIFVYNYTSKKYARLPEIGEKSDKANALKNIIASAGSPAGFKIGIIRINEGASLFFSLSLSSLFAFLFFAFAKTYAFKIAVGICKRREVVLYVLPRPACRKVHHTHIPTQITVNFDMRILTSGTLKLLDTTILAGPRIPHTK